MSRILPILFNTNMVRAILDGEKTVTRRVVGEKVVIVRKDQEINKNLNGRFELYNITSRCGLPQNVFFKPPYQPGDILYIRETWSEWTGGYVYKAWNEPFPQPGKSSIMKWHPSIHMPKEAARIWLKVTDVRVERLQDITIAEVIKEGCSDLWIDAARPMKLIDVAGNKNEFTSLWNLTLKKSDLDRYGWVANPWVWVIEFERCVKPEK